MTQTIEAPPKAPSAPVTENLVLESRYAEVAAKLRDPLRTARADFDQHELAIRRLEEQLLRARAARETARIALAELEGQHLDATTSAAQHREAAEFLAGKYGYTLTRPPVHVPPAQAGPVQCAHCGSPIHRPDLATKWKHSESGQYACRPDADASPWAEPWSEVPAAQGEQGAEVAAHV